MSVNATTAGGAGRSSRRPAVNLSLRKDLSKTNEEDENEEEEEKCKDEKNKKNDNESKKKNKDIEVPEAKKEAEKDEHNDKNEDDKNGDIEKMTGLEKDNGIEEQQCSEGSGEAGGRPGEAGVVSEQEGQSGEPAVQLEVDTERPAVGDEDQTVGACRLLSWPGF